MAPPDLSFSDGPSGEEMAESDADQFFAATHAQKRKATSRPEMESQATSQKKSNNNFRGFSDEARSHPTGNSPSSWQSTSRDLDTPNNLWLPTLARPQVESMKPKSAKTILIEPIGTPDEVKGFFANDIKLAREIDASLFGKYQIASINKNLARGLLIVNFHELHEEQLTKLLAVNSIGSRGVRCRLPQMQSLTHGVIGPVGVETDIEEILLELKKRHASLQSARRIMKDKNQTPSQCLQLTFSGKELPDYVSIVYQRFPVRLFVDRPWQCYNCQGFWHKAAHCRSRTRCVICSGAHSSKDCPNKNTTSVKCANCQGNHTASYGGCFKMKEAKAVEKVRAEQKLSYRDAVQAVSLLGLRRGLCRNHRSVQT